MNINFHDGLTIVLLQFYLYDLALPSAHKAGIWKQLILHVQLVYECDYYVHLKRHAGKIRLIGGHRSVVRYSTHIFLQEWMFYLDESNGLDS